MGMLPHGCVVYGEFEVPTISDGCEVVLLLFRQCLCLV